MTVRENDSLYIGAGPMRFFGLPYFLSNPFGKVLHNGSRYRPTAFSLDSGASAGKQQDFVLSIGTSRLKTAWLQVGTIFGAAGRASCVAGFGLGQSGNNEFRLEAFLSEATLPERESDAWFSDEPPLPERRQRLEAAAITLSTGNAQLFFCGALSETGAQGIGGYAKATGDLELGPLRVVVGTDAATRCFVDGSGSAVGEQFRALADLRYTRRSLGSFGLRGEIDSAVPLGEPSAIRLDGEYRFPSTAAAPFFRPVELTAETERKLIVPNGELYRFKTNARIGLGRGYLNMGAFFDCDERAVRDSFGAAVKTVAPMGKSMISLSAGTEIDAAGIPAFTLGFGVSADFKGGLVMASVATDSPSSWERLRGNSPSASPLGPWTVSLAWRFRERFQSRPPGVK
jgi:hypothetical protein